jgi:hypothetical protein
MADDNGDRGLKLGIVVPTVIAGTGFAASVIGHVWPDHWWNTQVPLWLWKWGLSLMVVAGLLIAVAIITIQSRGAIFDELHDVLVPPPQLPDKPERTPVVTRRDRDPNPPTAPLPRPPDDMEVHTQ